MAKGKAPSPPTAQPSKASEPKLKEKTKVIVRKLPPALNEESFKAALDKVCPPATYDWFCYYPGKVRCVGP